MLNQYTVMRNNYDYTKFEINLKMYNYKSYKIFVMSISLVK